MENFIVFFFFCRGNQADANFRIGLQIKNTIRAALRWDDLKAQKEVQIMFPVY